MEGIKSSWCLASSCSLSRSVIFSSPQIYSTSLFLPPFFFRWIQTFPSPHPPFFFLFEKNEQGTESRGSYACLPACVLSHLNGESSSCRFLSLRPRLYQTMLLFPPAFNAAEGHWVFMSRGIISLDRLVKSIIIRQRDVRNVKKPRT